MSYGHSPLCSGGFIKLRRGKTARPGQGLSLVHMRKTLFVCPQTEHFFLPPPRYLFIVPRLAKHTLGSFCRPERARYHRKQRHSLVEPVWAVNRHAITDKVALSSASPVVAYREGKAQRSKLISLSPLITRVHTSDSRHGKAKFPAVPLYRPGEERERVGREAVNPFGQSEGGRGV